MNDDMLVSYLLNEADPAVRQKVEQWIASDPANSRYFEHFKTILETSLSIPVGSNVNEAEAWQRFRNRTFAAGSKPGVVRPFYRSLLFRVAASLILVAGVAAMSYLAFNKDSGAMVITSTTDQTKNDTLSDGSVITLNKKSEISYATQLKGSERNINLKGEAFFNVKPDKNKPFVVRTGNVTVTVLGTSFNVKNAGRSIEVVVESGIVSVKRGDNTIVLKRGEKTILSESDSILKKEQVTDKLYNYYRSREFTCDDTPLWKLVETLNEAYGSNIVFANKELRTLPLTATFNNESLDNILAIISETFNITIERTKNSIVLK